MKSMKSSDVGLIWEQYKKIINESEERLDELLDLSFELIDQCFVPGKDHGDCAIEFAKKFKRRVDLSDYKNFDDIIWSIKRAVKFHNEHNIWGSSTAIDADHLIDLITKSGFRRWIR